MRAHPPAPPPKAFAVADTRSPSSAPKLSPPVSYRASSARLRASHSSLRPALAGLASLLQHRPHDVHVVRQLAISYTELGAADRAVELLSHVTGVMELMA